jgi:hypothetical protein
MCIVKLAFLGLVFFFALAVPAAACSNHGFYGGNRFSAFSAMTGNASQSTTFEDQSVAAEPSPAATAKVPSAELSPATTQTSPPENDISQAEPESATSRAPLDSKDLSLFATR